MNASRRSPGRMFIALALVILVLIAAATVSLVLFRMARALPPPTGAYAVGTSLAYVEDRNAVVDIPVYGEPSRRLVMQIWYPGQPSEQASFAKVRRCGETTWRNFVLCLVPTHSRWKLPLAHPPNGSFPFVLFNPAWNGERTQDTFLMEELASRGYVVMSVDHPGNSGPIEYPDGEVVARQRSPEMDGKVFASAERLFAIGNAELAKQAQDSELALAWMQIQVQTPGSPFYARVDMMRVGAFGHSFGGALAAQLALQDPRIVAALDMDGSLFGPVYQQWLRKPFLMMTEELPILTPGLLAAVSPTDRVGMQIDADDASNTLAMLRQNGGYLVTLHGSEHASFTDEPVFRPATLFRPGVKQLVNARHDLIRALVAGFFDKTLRGADPALLRHSGELTPSTTVQVFPAPAAVGVH